MDMTTAYICALTIAVTLVVVAAAAVPVIRHYNGKLRYARDKWLKVCEQDARHCDEIEQLKHELNQFRAAKA
jgi:hypothetical protein